jgi:hypothetical protein
MLVNLGQWKMPVIESHLLTMRFQELYYHPVHLGAILTFIIAKKHQAHRGARVARPQAFGWNDLLVLIIFYWHNFSSFKLFLL